MPCRGVRRERRVSLFFVNYQHAKVLSLTSNNFFISEGILFLIGWGKSSLYFCPDHPILEQSQRFYLYILYREGRNRPCCWQRRTENRSVPDCLKMKPSIRHALAHILRRLFKHCLCQIRSSKVRYCHHPIDMSGYFKKLILQHLRQIVKGRMLNVGAFSKRHHQDSSSESLSSGNEFYA